MDKIKTDLVVLGAGPGGYAAAFYAADLGKKVILVEKESRLGGVCLNQGCIPSKALLHATHQIRAAEESSARGIEFSAPKIHLDKMRAWKEGILEKLGQGILVLSKRRNVEILSGKGYFEDSQTLRVETAEGQKFIEFEHAIIAVGSKPTLPAAFDLGNPKIMTSTEALDIEDIPGELLIVGAGYIGMELGTVYAALGSKITLVEALDTMLSGVDADLVKPVQSYAEKNFKEIRLKAKVKKMSTSGKKIRVIMEYDGKNQSEEYDRVLVSVGRIPHCQDLGLENTNIQCDEKGFIKINPHQQTADSSLYAIGDVTGGVMLAHKAAKEARIAVEVITGATSIFNNIIIPAVIFTDPEIAWCGLTETEAEAKGIAIATSKVPWTASGRALTFDRTDGLTKLIIEPETERILGVGITGHGAGDLISEGVLAIEMGATVKDLAETVHPHPTLSETFMECAELFYGHATHVYARQRLLEHASRD